MSVKKCAREECGKTVYPIEELKCLDKVCFIFHNFVIVFVVLGMAQTML